MVRPWKRGDHLCLSYGADDKYRQALIVQLVAALEHGDKIAYVADEASSGVILGWLGDAGPGVDSVIRRGQAVVWSAAEFAVMNGASGPQRVLKLLAARVRDAKNDGYLGLHACVDMGAVLGGVPSMADLVEHEQWLRSSFDEGWLAGLTLACHYDEREFSEELLAAARQLHGVVLSAEQVQRRKSTMWITPLADAPGLRLVGELDRSNVAELSAALDTAFRDEHEFHLDLTALHYADVAAVRLLARIASGLHRGRRFVLRSPAPVVRTILRIYQWDQLPALRVVEEVTRS